MKVLDPQNALLTNAEVYQFLKSNPLRAADRQIGAYSTVSSAGHETVRKDFNRYSEEITPHVKSYADVQTWMPDLVKKLTPYDLTKTEVMNLINLGVGAPWNIQPSGDVNGEAETEETEEDSALARDELRFRVVVDEVDERFSGETGEERIREVIEIIRDTIKFASSATTDNSKQDEKQVSG